MHNEPRDEKMYCVMMSVFRIPRKRKQVMRVFPGNEIKYRIHELLIHWNEISIILTYFPSRAPDRVIIAEEFKQIILIWFALALITSGEEC